jgi:hypothetical protein
MDDCRWTAASPYILLDLFNRFTGDIRSHKDAQTHTHTHTQTLNLNKIEEKEREKKYY